MGASVAPPVFSAIEPTAAQTTDPAELSDRRVDAGHSARLRALIVALSGPDREIVEARVVAGVSIPDIVAILGVTPGVVGLAQHQALGALRPAATAHGPPPARKRVVLLPHARTKPT
jgi:DNA-directed RNA polymerase specialized sigma24 family protein